MKTVILFMFMLISLTGYAQTVIRDHNVRRQIQRQTHQRWEKFRPRWYFVLFHNRYRKGEDRRVMRQLTPTLLSLNENEEKATTEKEQFGEVTRIQAAQGASRTIQLTYHLHFKSDLASLADAFTTKMDQANSRGVPTKFRAVLLEEGLSLLEEQALLLKGYLPAGQLSEALQRLIRQWETLLMQMDRLTAYYKLPALPN